MGGTREISHRRAVVAGLTVSGVLHLAVLSFARFTVSPVAGPVREVRVVKPAARPEPQIVVLPRPVARPAARSALPARAAHAFVPVRASLSSAVPNPLSLLEQIEVVERPRDAVASYAEVSDFLADSAATRALRPIDDRPVEVLAGLDEAARSVGVTIGGDGICPPGLDLGRGVHRGPIAGLDLQP